MIDVGSVSFQRSSRAGAEAPDSSTKMLHAGVKGGKVHIDWADGHCSTFHHIWLRDNCKCPDCREPTTGQKMLFVPDIPIDIEPQSVGLQGNTLQIAWRPNGHRSDYSGMWLRRHCYSESERLKRRRKPKIWGSEINAAQPVVEYHDLIETDAGKLQMLDLLCDYGFVVIHGTPVQPDVAEKLGNLIGPPRETVYGRIEDVIAQPNPKLFGNSNRALTVHMDMPYIYWPPDIGIFHCLASASPGEGVKSGPCWINGAGAR